LDTSPRSRPIPLYVLIVGMLFQGISGLVGGVGLVIDSAGEFLDLSVDLLIGSPFQTFLVPGLILLVILGIAPMVVSVGLMKRTRWAWYGSLTLGCALVIWILTQIAIIGYWSDPPLQLVYGVLGIVLAGLTLLPSVRKILLID
jgi:hypothetical protein